MNKIFVLIMIGMVSIYSNLAEALTWTEQGGWIGSCVVVDKPPAPVTTIMVAGDRSKIYLSSSCHTDRYGLEIVFSHQGPQGSGSQSLSSVDHSICVPVGTNNLGIMTMTLPMSNQYSEATVSLRTRERGDINFTADSMSDYSNVAEATVPNLTPPPSTSLPFLLVQDFVSGTYTSQEFESMCRADAYSNDCSMYNEYDYEVYWQNDYMGNCTAMGVSQNFCNDISSQTGSYVYYTPAVITTKPRGSNWRLAGKALGKILIMPDSGSQANAQDISKLHVSDGTTITKVTDKFQEVYSVKEASGYAVVIARDSNFQYGLWRTDFTDAGTVKIENSNSSNSGEIISFSGEVYFIGATATNPVSSLYRVDPSNNTLRTIVFGVQIDGSRKHIVINNQLYMELRYPVLTGMKYALFKLNNNKNSIELIDYIDPTTNWGAFNSDDVVHDSSGNIYFNFSNKIKKITPSGIMSDIATLPGYPSSIKIINDSHLILTYNQEIVSYNLSNGTLITLKPANQSYQTITPAIINGAAHWIVTDTDDYSFDDNTATNEIKFFKTTDGVNVENYKTILLSQLNQTELIVLPEIMKLGSKIYIKAKYVYNTYSDEPSLVIETDGTELGTKPLSATSYELSGINNLFYGYFTELNGVIYFPYTSTNNFTGQNDPTYLQPAGRELYKFVP